MITQLDSGDASIYSFRYDVLFSTQLNSACVWFGMYSAHICTNVCVWTQVHGLMVCVTCVVYGISSEDGLRINGQKNN